MMIRPTGVLLARHMEHWRQVHGRKLAAEGALVRDIDATAPYAQPVTALPTAGAAPGVPAASADPATLAYQPLRLLTGPLGVGKSAVLAYLVAYARQNKWLTVFLPDTWDIMHNSLILVPSRRRPGMVDQHDIALKLLQVCN